MYKDTDLLDSIYDRDPASQAYIIKIVVKHYSDLFNNLDAYPLNRRDIDNDILSYIDDCSEDIPVKYKVKLQVIYSDEVRTLEQENRVRTGLKAYFNYLILLLRREVRATWTKSFIYMVAWLIFVTGYYLLNQHPESEGIFLGMLKEGLSIGGWVFLWEAFVQVSFKNSETRKEIREYSRLRDADIEIIYR